VGEHPHEPLLEWSAAERCRTGERTTGDRAAVRITSGRALLAVIDGLGHGPEAERAALAAERVVLAQADRALGPLVRDVHGALRGTRGAAISLALVSGPGRTLTWLGLGNVQGRLLGGRGAGTRSLRLHGGIAGHDLPTMRPETVPVHRGDVLILATDGVAPGFADGLAPTGTPAALAARILGAHGTTGDDALVLVARFLGGGGDG
jgi:hypothetical protein